MNQYSISAAESIAKITQSINALPEQVAIASMRALNKTAAWIKSNCARQIAKEKLLKLKIINDRIRVVKASTANLQAKILADVVSIRARDLGNLRQTSGGAIAGKHSFEKAFVATMPKTSYRSAFKRTAKARYPVKEMWLPIYNEATAIIAKMIDAEASAIFEKHFLHELRFITGAI
ncbi:hypothetical protein FACS1894126_5550 [Alphaproteobacteria bacterium]|nr:hypothetical protein FACS1894122_13350 [Alphaproteobacteria bacterium]GHT99368.1 hypothetical protein FACS1894126_5550 [Alphaproteobacteria bacterium]